MGKDIHSHQIALSTLRKTGVSTSFSNGMANTDSKSGGVTAKTTTGWILLLDSQPVVFDSEAAAISAAQLRCIWLKAQSNPETFRAADSQMDWQVSPQNSSSTCPMRAISSKTGSIPNLFGTHVFGGEKTRRYWIVI